MSLSERTAEEIFLIFNRVFGGRQRPFTLHSRTFSGRELYRRSCRVCRAAAAGRADCAHCGGGSYKPLMAEDILNHLNGGTAVGLYPADENGLCRFCVLELDGRAPALALKTLKEACERIEADCLCEICSGGETARLWLFFGRTLSPAVSVYAALRLLDEAFAADMSTAGVVTGILPVTGAGFGRPAVLPLFDLKSGQSFLLDGDFEPCADPLSLLENFEPRPADFSFPPCQWAGELIAERCGSLYIDAARLSPTALSALCRAACFPDGEASEFSSVPAAARCFSLTGGKLALPGRLDLAEALPFANIKLIDGGAEGRPLRLTGGDSLRGWQREAFERAAAAGGGIITAPTGSGKTAVILALLRHFSKSALILTPDGAAAAHWKRNVIDGLGLKEEAVGLVLEDRDWPRGLIDIAVLRDGAALRLAEQLPGYGVIIAADCDRMTNGPALRECMENVCARRIYGCSARSAEGSRLAHYIELYIGKTVYTYKRSGG